MYVQSIIATQGNIYLGMYVVYRASLSDGGSLSEKRLSGITQGAKIVQGTTLKSEIRFCSSQSYS